MMKKILNYLLLSLLFILFIFGIKFNSFSASVYKPFTIVTNPGEDASTTINISFQTYLDINECEVEYTLKSDEYWFKSKTIKASGIQNFCFDGNSSKNSSGTNITENGKLNDYNVTISNLDPDTEYMYKVIGTDESDVHYFKTAGSNDYSFAWIGDFHSYLPIPNRLKVSTEMVNTLIKTDPSIDFVLSTGDDIAWGGSYSFWERLYEESYFKNYMHVACIGNHDHMDRTSEKNSNEYFKMVTNNPLNGYEGEEGVSFWMIYSNSLYFFLNNETLGTKSTETCINWMRDVINSHPTQYIFIVAHYQNWNAITGATGPNYNRFHEFCDEVGVDVVFTGNQHIYLRTYSLYGGKVSTDEGLGTVYIQCPSSDNERGQDMNAELTYNKDLIASRFTEGGRTVGGSIVKVSESGIYIRLLDRNGATIDQVEIKAKRNNFDMSGFNKEKFINELTFTNSSLSSDSIYLKVPELALDYVKNIKIFENDEEIYTLVPKGKRDLVKYLNNITIDKTHEYDIVIQYNDNSKDKYHYYVDFFDYDFEYLKVGYDEEEDMIAVRYYLDCPYVSKYKVYFNDELYMQTQEEELLLSAASYKTLNTIKVEAITKDKRVISTAEYKPINYGDCNFDGILSTLDLDVMVSKIKGESGYFNKDMGDLNKDGQIDLKDLMILKLILDDKKDLRIYSEKKVVVNYNDHTSETLVKEGTLFTPIKEDDVTCFTKDGMYFEEIVVFDDLEINAVYEVEPKSVTINGQTKVVVGQSYEYKAYFTPLYACDSFIFIIDPDYAKELENGLIEFIKAGDTEIKVKSLVNGIEYSLKVSITGGN